MFRIKIRARARKELKQISKAHQLAIRQVLEEIKEDPTIGKPLTRELVRSFSYRIGVYQIIYKINKQDKLIYILTAGHRAKVYG